MISNTDGHGLHGFPGLPGLVEPRGQDGTASNQAGEEPNSWFVAFGPNPNPQYVVLAVIDQGGYGADAAAPLVRNIFNYLLANPETPTVKTPTPSSPASLTAPATNPPAGTRPPPPRRPPRRLAVRAPTTSTTTGGG